MARQRSREWYVTNNLKLLEMGVAAELGTTIDPSSDLQAALTCAAPVVFDALPHWQDWLLAAGDPFTTEVTQCLWTTLPKLESFASHVASFAGTDKDSHLWHLYEFFLGAERKVRGVYYTPPAIARYVIAQADRHLRDDFGMTEGLADDLPFHILEPACGSGAFIAALLERVRPSPSFDQAAAERMVSRLIAIDISPVAVFLTRLRLAIALQKAGIVLSASFPQPQFVCGNALAGPHAVPELRKPIGVVLGNPPFSYLSQNELPWIQSLIRGTKEHAGYFAIDGESLGEKKTWLHDDYVKFLRLAQWCIEQNGSGVVSLVTNHGWLDNATFRIARQQLLRTFSQIAVVDLHGNAKRHEASPTGERDENVFGIAQGIALVTMTKGGTESGAQVSRADLWGSRATKLQQLSEAADGPLASESIIPTAPWFTFARQTAELPAEYQAAPLLTELMPINSTVPVTARDHFVVAVTREELQQRLAEFCDPKISDEEIRRKYFQRTRSNRYEPGDTRGWKLPAVRRTLMNEADPASCIRRCLYRPFVWRYVLWHPAMIDWPRTEFTRHFDGGENLALLARRQSIAGREANFFWITDCLPLDGVIRSDNRGSESFFPLWLNDATSRRANLASDLITERDPAQLLAYCYALFHSPTYRTRYASGLAMEFPRVLLPVLPELFSKLSVFGQQLIALHRTSPLDKAPTFNLQSDICPLQSQIETFHVGTYNVCRKWLQMEQQARDSAAFQRLQQLLAATIDLQQQIEAAIIAAGGFPAAFAKRTGSP